MEAITFTQPFQKIVACGACQMKKGLVRFMQQMRYDDYNSKAANEYSKILDKSSDQNMMNTFYRTG